MNALSLSLCTAIACAPPPPPRSAFRVPLPLLLLLLRRHLRRLRVQQRLRRLRGRAGRRGHHAADVREVHAHAARKVALDQVAEGAVAEQKLAQEARDRARLRSAAQRQRHGLSGVCPAHARHHCGMRNGYHLSACTPTNHDQWHMAHAMMAWALWSQHA